MVTRVKRNFFTLFAVAFLGCSLSLATVSNGWGQNASEAEISTYIEQLKTDSDWRKRSQAASALGEMRQETDTVVPALIEALQDEDEVVRLRATFALTKFGVSVAPDLIESLKVENEAARSSAAFALRYMGFPVAPLLTDALKSGDEQVRSYATSVLRQMAKDLQNRPLSQAPSIAELKQAVSALEEALKEIQLFLKLRNPTATLEDSLVLLKAGYKQEDIKAIRQSSIAFRADIRAHYVGIGFGVFFWSVVSLFAAGGLTLWRRPELLLRLNKAITQAKQDRELLDRVLSEAQQFLKRAGVTTRREGKRGLTIASVSGRLKPYAPLPVTFADEPIDRDVTELVKHSARMAGNRRQQAGILLYRESPDTLFRMRMAEVRLRDNFVLIPIPLAAVEQALLDGGGSSGLLAQYADRYLPGADLFDDRNAIGDTLSFFGRVELLQCLEDDLRRHQSIGLFGLRKSGKTSILLQLGFALRQHPVIHVDLQPYGGKPRYGAELFDLVLQKLAQLAKERPSKSAPSVDRLERDRPAPELTADFARQVSQLARRLNQAGYELPILLFLDEIERILPTETDSRERVEEFNACFGVLRALSQERRLLALLAADVHPDCNRINQWAQPGIPTNPAFNFFKEVFVLPFSPAATTRMLTDIGKLMGVEFDAETLAAIHRESGGYPFIARQLASLLCKKVAAERQGEIQESAARRYLNEPFTYSGVLKDYFGQNIWSDLEKRNFASAMSVCRLLACNERSAAGIEARALHDRLSDDFTESERLDALLWLEAVGLVRREESQERDRYRLQVPLMSRWLRMQMKEEEIRQWQL